MSNTPYSLFTARDPGNHRILIDLNIVFIKYANTFGGNKFKILRYIFILCVKHYSADYTVIFRILRNRVKHSVQSASGIQRAPTQLVRKTAYTAAFGALGSITSPAINAHFHSVPRDTFSTRNAFGHGKHRKKQSLHHSSSEKAA